MRKWGLLIGCLFLVAGTAFGAGSIISSFKAPGQYAVGLDYHSPYLYHADYTANWIRVTTTTGSVVRTIPLPRTPTIVKFNDLAYTGTRLWGVEYSPSMVYQLTTAGGFISSFVPPFPSRGLTFDGRYLWDAHDYNGNLIWQLTTTGSRIKSFAGPDDYNGSVDWADGYIWIANHAVRTGLFRITTNGSIVESIVPPPSGGRPMGVAWDGNYLWYTDYQKGYVYQITTSVSILPASVGRVKALFR